MNATILIFSRPVRTNDKDNTPRNKSTLLQCVHESNPFSFLDHFLPLSALLFFFLFASPKYTSILSLRSHFRKCEWSVGINCDCVLLMRRTSVSLPTKAVAHDPHEKSARYNSYRSPSGITGILENLKTAWMGQSQRSRYVKTGGILLFVVFLFYYLAPHGTDVYDLGGMWPHQGSYCCAQTDIIM